MNSRTSCKKCTGKITSWLPALWVAQGWGLGSMVQGLWCRRLGFRMWVLQCLGFKVWVSHGSRVIALGSFLAKDGLELRV